MTPSTADGTWLVLGAAGFVGTALSRFLSGRHRVEAVSRKPPAAEVRWIPVRGPPEEIVAAILTRRPVVVVNAIAIASTKACEDDPDLAESVNAWLPAFVAETCRRTGARLVHLSTDQVFDGRRGGYTEVDEPRPIHVYGRTKRAGEERVLRILPASVVVRLNLVVGRSAARPSATDHLLSEAAAGRHVTLFTDEHRSPVAIDDVCRGVTELAQGEFGGLVHLGGPLRLSRFELGRAALAAHGLAHLARPALRPSDAAPPRPADTSFDSTLARGLLREPPGDPLRSL